MKKYFLFSLSFILLSCTNNVNKVQLQDKIRIDSVKEICLSNYFTSKNQLEIRPFLRHIGNLNRSKGVWKYYKKTPLVFIRDNGSDTIYTNGYVFQYKNNYFVSENDLIKNYFGISITGK